MCLQRPVCVSLPWWGGACWASAGAQARRALPHGCVACHVCRRWFHASTCHVWSSAVLVFACPAESQQVEAHVAACALLLLHNSQSVLTQTHACAVCDPRGDRCASTARPS
jgi:hypothetical protein